MLHVEDVFYGTLRGGLLDGLPAVNIVLCKEGRSDVPDLVGAVKGFGASLTVKLLGDVTHNPDEELYSLCSSLKEQGHFIAAEVSGSEKRPWMDTLHYRIVRISEEPWALFAAQEIRYAPSGGGKIPSPHLAGIHYGSFCYLLPHRDSSGEDIFVFLRSHPGFRVMTNREYRTPIKWKEEP